MARRSKKAGTGGQVIQLPGTQTPPVAEEEVPYTPRTLKAAIEACLEAGIIESNTDTSIRAQIDSDRIARIYRDYMDRHPREGLSEAEARTIKSFLSSLAELIDPSHEHFTHFTELLQLGQKRIAVQEQERERRARPYLVIAGSESTNGVLNGYFDELINTMKTATAVTLDVQARITRLEAIRDCFISELANQGISELAVSPARKEEVMRLLKDNEERFSHLHFEEGETPRLVKLLVRKIKEILPNEPDEPTDEIPKDGVIRPDFRARRK